MGHLDLTGQRFGRLVVRSYAGNYKWLCRCDCGTEKVVAAGNLRNGHTKSCGCYKAELARKRVALIDLTGQRFGRWLVLSYAESSAGKRRWLCRCDCGTERIVMNYVLRNGLTNSCGCYNLEVVTKHGHSRHYKRTKEYRAYSSAKARCNNPNKDRYADYGGRGIKFLFNSFEEFFEELGYAPSPEHSIDRIDNEGNYEPGNVRWATCTEQIHNRRSHRAVA